MNPYIEQLKNELHQFTQGNDERNNFSILEFLWYCYSAENPIDDGRIRASETALAPVYKELSFCNADHLFDLIVDLCTAYQRAAFLEGIQIGTQISAELDV